MSTTTIDIPKHVRRSFRKLRRHPLLSRAEAKEELTYRVNWTNYCKQRIATASNRCLTTHALADELSDWRTQLHNAQCRENAWRQRYWLFQP